MCASKHALSPPFHVQEKKRWIIRALGPVVDLASFFIETWRCDLCDDLFHRFDFVNASVEARGYNVRMESHKFDGHTQTKRRLGALEGTVRFTMRSTATPHRTSSTLSYSFDAIERMTL